MSSSLRRSASTRDADVEGGAVYDDDIDWTKVKRTQKGKAPPLTLLGAGVCAAWLCLTTTRTVGRYEAFVACCVAYGALFSTYLRKWIAKRSGGDSAMRAISQPIADGAAGFLRVQYAAIFRLAAPLALLIGLSYKLRPPPRGAAGAAQAVSRTTLGCVASCCFLVGAGCSALSGYAAMRVASHANVRVADAAKRSAADALVVCFRGGAFSAVLNLTLCIVGVLVLFGVIHMAGVVDDAADVPLLLVGYGFGASFVALFMQLGGGIYTKAADVGADLVGKVVHGLEEDDPKNPATIADNVGDNVGDVAGMGSDLFGSLAESTCAALVIASTSSDLLDAGWAALLFPLTISAAGILVCMACSFIATDLKPAVREADVESALKLQLISTTFLVVPVVVYLAHALLPDKFELPSVVSGTIKASSTGAAICVSVGALGGLLIGLVTEYYTSHSYEPVRECAHVCKQGAAVNLIYGLALGYRSAIVPVYTLAAIVYFAFSLADLYGVALAALGMLSTLATGLTIDGYGPVTDNAGGIAEMAQLPAACREKTDCLDAAGNTTAAIGKGFAIGSAALVSLALYGAFVVRLGITTGVNVLTPLTFAALLVGANLPYWFSAMTMKSVGLAAAEMVQEVERQFKADPSLLDPNSTSTPDYDACVEISTKASLREMIAPAALVMLTPLVAGTFFGVEAVFGILTGGLVSGVQLAISMSNSGGAWDNAKKYISGGFDPDPALRKKDGNGNSTPAHDAAVTGDTVGDPFKDTSGPALNILMKLMAILSLVFAQYFESINGGKGLFKL